MKFQTIISRFKKKKILCILVAFLSMLGYSQKTTSKKYKIFIYQTSQEGGNLELISNKKKLDVGSTEKKVSLKLLPEEKLQEYIGFGASFTESSAWNLATIPVDLRKQVLTSLFSPTEGAGFSLARTHINSSDYSNEHYTYVEEGDRDLVTFSIQEDMKGFTGKENSQVLGVELIEPTYDLIPMILEASEIPGADFKIIATPWSPPSWMKSGETAEMINGSIMPEYYGVWAKYLSMYISAYKEKGIDLWGITPQNEPLHSYDAQWDSNGLSAEQGRDFLRDYLGPQLVKDGHLNIDDLDEGLKVLIYDHNKSTMNDYVSYTYRDPEAAKYAWGTAFHWYANSELEKNNWFVEDLNKHKERWPDKGMIHSESSIDIDAKDPIGQYWRESTDYAGKFVPFDTYAYDIITDLNSGTQGYVEWCIILSDQGQPNPYNNFNSAPVLINPVTDEVIYTPLYYILSHFSKFIRPGAVRIGLEGNQVDGVIYTAAINKDGSLVVVAFNKNEEPCEFVVSLEDTTFSMTLDSRSLQTIQMQPESDN